MPSSSPSAPPETGPAPANSDAEPAAQPAQAPEIDLEALAEKVYALLREELRLERERLGQTWFGR